MQIKWISVKDKLPESEKEVIFLISYSKYEESHGGELIEHDYLIIVEGYAFYAEDIELNYFYKCPHLSFDFEDETLQSVKIDFKSQYLNIPNEWVTHWMPIPALPKE